MYDATLLNGGDIDRFLPVRHLDSHGLELSIVVVSCSCFATISSLSLCHRVILLLESPHRKRVASGGISRWARSRSSCGSEGGSGTTPVEDKAPNSAKGDQASLDRGQA